MINEDHTYYHCLVLTAYTTTAKDSVFKFKYTIYMYMIYTQQEYSTLSK